MLIMYNPNCIDHALKVLVVDRGCTYIAMIFTQSVWTVVINM